MKYFLLFFGLVLSIPAFSQDTINPYNIGQPMNILLQDSDVYYRPYAPPAPTDTRDSLSSVCTLLSNPNGSDREYYLYAPMTHGDTLKNWAPCGIPLGPYATWQRFFTAERDSLGNPHDIIAGGGAPGTRVTVSANEDVDFRASGRVILKSGFHVKPGAFFHAYTDLHWGDSVFSDEFDSTALDPSKWYVSTGNGDVELSFQCSSDSDVRDTADPDAHDGHALDIDLREVPGACSCDLLKGNDRADCTPTIDSIGGLPIIKQFRFATSNIQSCPIPFLAEDSPWTPWYQHAPYGKYEIREKIPHILHHTNDWGESYPLFEWDMGETVNASDLMKQRDIGYVLPRRHGPFIGKFGTAVVSGDTINIFRSGQANFSNTNSPNVIYIDNFPYTVSCVFRPTDTFLMAIPNTPYFPSALTGDTTDSISFNYQRVTTNTADTVTWTAAQNGTDTVWKIFSAPYRDSVGHLKYFSKNYQPTSVTIHSSFGAPKTYTCYWRADLNDTGTGGVLWLDNGLDSSDLNTNTEAYSYTVNENYDAPIPEVAFYGNDTTGGYVYHTYTMELLPNEMRYLIDGNVVRRFPDRLIPPSNFNYDVISNVPRSPTTIQPAEFGIQQSTYDSAGASYNDSLGTHPGTATYMQRQYFESHLGNPGMWDVEIPPGSGKWYHAAHHLIDYVKIWDVPKDVIIPNFPQ